MNKHSQGEIYFNKKKVIIYRVLILFSILESLIILIILSTNFIERNRLLIDQKPEYLVLVFLFVLLLLFLGFLVVESYVKQTLIIKINQKISRIANKTYIGILLTCLIFIGLVVELYFLFPATEYYQQNDQLMDLHLRERL